MVMGLGLLVVRAGPLGRMLVALRDSPAACGTLGLDQRWFRVGLFAVSAGMAGVAGALYAGLRGTVGAAEFQFFGSFTLLLMAVVFGVTSVTGAALGGIGLMMLPVLQADYPGIAGLFFVVIAVGAILLARDPNGLANQLFRLGNMLDRRYGTRVRERIPVLPVPGGSIGGMREIARAEHDANAHADHTLDTVGLGGAPGPEGTDGRKETAGVQ